MTLLIGFILDLLSFLSGAYYWVGLVRVLNVVSTDAITMQYVQLILVRLNKLELTQKETDVHISVKSIIRNTRKTIRKPHCPRPRSMSPRE